MKNPIVRLLAALLALAVLAGCSSSSGTELTNDGNPWSYTDASGKTVKVDHTPNRIIAHAYAAAALMSFGIKPIAIYADSDLKTDPGTKNLDLTGITVIGQEWGEIDVEKAAELKPDLIVGDWWPMEKAHSGFESGVKDESTKLADLAPVVGPANADSVLTLIEGYEKLAQSLGAKTDDPAIAAQRERFNTSIENFKSAVAAKPGITALALSPTEDGLAIAVPKGAPELLDFQSWGLNVIVPNTPDPDFPYWETLSWENADKYQADLLLVDSREYPANVEAAKKHPTWNALKAAEAGAMVSWPGYWLHTYGDYATQLESLTAAVNAANPDLVS